MRYWIAVDHWNTDNPHVHLLVRGVAADGSDLVISRDYISHGLRSRAEELVSIELGLKPEREVRSALEREVDAERWTRLDMAIRLAADETGFIDLRPDHPGAGDPEVRRLAIGRLQRLERMGLAEGHDDDATSRGSGTASGGGVDGPGTAEQVGQRALGRSIYRSWDSTATLWLRM